MESTRPQTSLSFVQTAYCQLQDSRREPQYNAPRDCLIDRTRKGQHEPQLRVHCPSFGVSICICRAMHWGLACASRAHKG